MWWFSFRRFSWRWRRPRLFPRSCKLGSLFAPSRVSPDFSKLDPIAGLRSLVSPQRMWNVGRALLAAVAVGFLSVSHSRATHGRSRQQHREHRSGIGDRRAGRAANCTRCSAHRAGGRGHRPGGHEAGVSNQAQDDQGRGETRAPRKRGRSSAQSGATPSPSRNARRSDDQRSARCYGGDREPRAPGNRSALRRRRRRSAQGGRQRRRRSRSPHSRSRARLRHPGHPRCPRGARLTRPRSRRHDPRSALRSGRRDPQRDLRSGREQTTATADFFAAKNRQGRQIFGSDALGSCEAARSGIPCSRSSHAPPQILAPLAAWRQEASTTGFPRRLVASFLRLRGGRLRWRGGPRSGCRLFRRGARRLRGRGRELRALR